LDDHIFEVIVCSLDDAIAAQKGGANRLEIISHYEVGGLTPSLDLVREIVEVVNIPARVMVRDEEDFIVTDEKKIERLCEYLRSLQELPIDGFVLGFLKSDRPEENQIDHELVARLLACIPRVKATFHRAFEELAEPLAAIRELKRHPQIDCILTSGGPQPWAEKLSRFESWEQTGQPEIRMLIGGGMSRDAIGLFCETTELRAFHVGTVVREGGRIDGPVRAELVKELAVLIGRYRRK
jgi:copper homeostasis protein